MPTILKVDPFRFFFYSGDRHEPCHVHVERDAKIAKIWIDPVRLQSSGGFSRKELSKIIEIIVEHRIDIQEAWNDYFGC